MSVVFALATPPAKSAICVFRVSGDGCHSALSKVFSGDVFPPNGFSVETLRHKNRVVDRVGLVVFGAPKSYTGEDSFEIYAHGSLAVMSNIVDVFKELGFEEAPGGEFTKRAFLNDKITLVEAERSLILLTAQMIGVLYCPTKPFLVSCHQRLCHLVRRLILFGLVLRQK
jgi:tRNA modification GTPase